MAELTFDSITTLEACDEAINACKANPALASMVAPLTAHRELLANAIEEAEKWQPFIALANEAIGDLPKYQPDWRKLDSTQTIAIVTREVTDHEAKPVKVKLADGTEEMRQPPKLVREIVLGVMPTTLTAGKGKADTTRKLAVTVLRMDDVTKPPTIIGQFRTSAEACKYLNITTNGDSAKRKLEGAGYIVQSYDGTDYTVSES